MAADPYKYFRVEARELVEQMGQGTLDLEKGRPSQEDIARLLRFAHTLKGAARVVKQPQIAEHAHQLEDLFGALRDRTAPPSRDHIDRVLSLLDQIGVLIAALSPAEAAPAETRAEAGESPHSFRRNAEDVDALLDGVAEAQKHLAALRPRMDQAARIGHLIELIGDQLGGLDVRGAAAAADPARMEKARSLIGELRARFAAQQRTVARAIDQIDNEVRQVGDAASRLRLVPADMIFRFLERAVRDAAQALGKRVTFEGRGGTVRVDSDILTIVQGALLQLVRNAVAHGIESSEALRRAAGKVPEGRVTVSVLRRGSAIAFTCTDDGGGVDFDAVRRTLQRERVPGAEGPADEETLLRLLLRGGITTSRALTDMAGRGIGLDIVREAAQRLRGEVTMRSRRGQGTTVELVMPASIASFHALLVEAGGVTAAIPLEAVTHTLRVRPDEIIEHGNGRSVRVGDAAMPLWSLAGIVQPQEGHRRLVVTSPACVVRSGEQSAVVIVDRVLGTGPMVTRPLPARVVATPAIAGAALDAGGRPSLVINPTALVTEASRPGTPVSPITTTPRPILVVDDSLTTRMLEQSILESAGYEVTLAVSGEDGLEKARAGNFALFLVDVEMPGIDGFTFIEQVRADSALRDVPAILVTSRASADDRRRGREVGAQGYIVKGDFDQGALLEQIRSLV